MLEFVKSFLLEVTLSAICFYLDMNMHRMKDECLAVLLLLASLLVSVSDAKLNITQESATKLVNNNSTFFVLCFDSEAYAISWKGPKGILGPKTRPIVQTTPYGTSIVFKGIAMEDSGTYICSTKNEQKEFRLEIAAPLTFMDTSSNQTGREGEDVTLRCEVKGGGTITWSVEGVDITDEKKFKVMGDGLLIRKVNRSDSKTYVCKAVQQITGEMVDRQINFRVLHKPVFTHEKYAKQELLWGYINGTVNLTCDNLVAEPPPKFQWSKVKDPKKKIGIIINESPKVSILQLLIDNSTFGNYKCTAENQYGKLEKYFSLDRGTKPQPPSSVELEKANSTVLNLRIYESDKNETILWKKTIGFNVQYKKDGDSEWENRDFNITEDNVYLLDNLSPITNFDVRVAARNAAGLSDYTNISTFTTSEADSVHLTPPSLYSVVLVATVMLFETYYIAFW